MEAVDPPEEEFIQETQAISVDGHSALDLTLVQEQVREDQAHWGFLAIL